uniref:J domain-containing protein n=1 Tax=Parastrongyloides trichosuri TaxID=131310 RepID=A0A0N4ZLA7_PARTI
MGAKQSPYQIGIFLYSLLLPVVLTSGSDADGFLKQGMAHLAKGQLQEAAQQFQSAIDIDSKNYQAYYRKATVLLAMGRPDSAIEDLTKVIELKPDFVSAVNQRAGVYMKQCELQKARDDYKNVYQHEKTEENKEKLDLVTNTETFVEYGTDYFENNDYSNAIPYLSKAIENCPWAPSLYRKRAKCYENIGEVQKAITDLRAVTKLASDSRETYLEVSKLHYNIGDIESSLVQIRECLKLDPDDKNCFAFYKKVKKLAKLKEQIEKAIEKKKWMDCLNKAVEIFKAEKENDRIQLDTFRYTCKCNMKAGHSAEAIQDCTQVLDNLNADDVEVLVDRAEAYIINENYESAVEDYKRAHELDENNNSINEGYQKAQRLLKQSKKKDYYKILGLKRNANKNDVMRAYRKLARKWHPDNFQDEKEKKKAEAMFIDIAAAKEVLSDPEKKAQFDNGQDPLDPESQQGSHAHPFTHGFHHFQQGGFGGFDFGDGGNFGGFKFTFG